MARMLRLVLVACVALSASFARAGDVAPKRISEERAIAVATKAGGDFLGTWVSAADLGAVWCISAHSKSAKAPTLYLVDAQTAHVHYGTENSDAASVEGLAIETQHGSAKAPAIELLGGTRVLVKGLAAWPADALGRRLVATGYFTLVEKTLELTQTGYHLRRR